MREIYGGWRKTYGKFQINTCVRFREKRGKYEAELRKMKKI